MHETVAQRLVAKPNRPLIIWLTALGTFPASLTARNVPGHLKHSPHGSFAQLCGLSALAYLTLSESIAIDYATPLLLRSGLHFLLPGP